MNLLTVFIAFSSSVLLRLLLHFFSVRQTLRRKASATGAVCFETGAVVGEGVDPKSELLRWANDRTAFSTTPVCAPDVEVPKFTLSPGRAPTKLETHPERHFLGAASSLSDSSSSDFVSALSESQRNFRVAPQLSTAASYSSTNHPAGVWH